MHPVPLEDASYIPLRDAYTASKRSVSFSSLMEVPSRTNMSRRSSATDISSIWSCDSLDLAHVSGRKTFNSLLLNDTFDPTLGLGSELLFPKASAFRDPSANLEGTSKNGPFCKYFAQGFCSKGENCTFSHAVQKRVSNPLPFTGFPNPIGSQTLRKPKQDATSNRYTGVPLNELLGQIQFLCTDQHGCRYLQKKLEEENELQTELIFNHVFPHYNQLMIDPFGNYLCQRLVEFCSDSQRAALIDCISPDLVSISLNMHGTRAVQKIFDFLTTAPVPSNADLLVLRMCHGLARHVVALIKDLNGNHVIQKCLVKLTPQQNQFIYDAVTKNCVQVSTHRHGCCVLQRCIDYASDSQRMQLVSEITFNSLNLVQDPFGNYVVQYILDLGNPTFSNAIVKSFTGNLYALSVQKFSSNVVEKAIRVANFETRTALVCEMLQPEKLEMMLKDLYANYVVQTALDCCDPDQRLLLIEAIKPILPFVRNTPFGKRIQNKIMKLTFATSPGDEYSKAMNSFSGLYI